MLVQSFAKEAWVVSGGKVKPVARFEAYWEEQSDGVVGEDDDNNVKEC